MVAIAIVVASVAGALYGAREVAAIGAMAGGGVLACWFVFGLLARVRWAMRAVLFLALGWVPGVVMDWGIHIGLAGRVTALLLIFGSAAVCGAIVRLPGLVSRSVRAG